MTREPSSSPVSALHSGYSAAAVPTLSCGAYAWRQVDCSQRPILAVLDVSPHKVLVDDDKARQCGNRRAWELQPDRGAASHQPIAEFRVRGSDQSPQMSLPTASAVSPLHNLEVVVPRIRAQASERGQVGRAHVEEILRPARDRRQPTPAAGTFRCGRSRQPSDDTAASTTLTTAPQVIAQTDAYRSLEVSQRREWPAAVTARTRCVRDARRAIGRPYSLKPDPSLHAAPGDVACATVPKSRRLRKTGRAPSRWGPGRLVSLASSHTLPHDMTTVKASDEATMPDISFLADTSTDGLIAADRLSHLLHITRAELSMALGLSRDAVSKATRVGSPATQARLRDMVEIINRVRGWAGSPQQAFAWYRSQPLPSFGDQTAEALVKEGRAEAVKRHLDRIAVGGYA